MEKEDSKQKYKKDEPNVMRVDGEAWERYFKAQSKIKKFDITNDKIYWEEG